MATLDPALIRRILIVRLAAVGDVLLTTPLLRVLRTSFPRAHIRYLTAMPAALEILRNNPDVDECQLSHGEIYQTIGQEPPFDLAVDLFGSRATQLICALSGAPYRLGPKLERTGVPPYSILLPDVEAAHILDHYARFATALGLSSPGSETFLTLDASERDRARELLSSMSISPGEAWLGMQPGARRDAMPWSSDHFIELGREWSRRVLVFAGPNDEGPVAERVAEQIGSSAVFVPVLPIREYAAVLERCKLFVTNEGGAGHIAAALGLRTIVILTSPAMKYWFPYDDNQGMVALMDVTGRELTADQVLRTASSLLDPIKTP